MKYKIVTLILLLGFIIGLRYTTQVSIAEESSIDLDNSEAISGIKHSLVDNTGNIYVTGITESEDIFFTKFSDSGQQLWQQTIYGSGFDEVERIRLDNNGDIILLAQTQSDDIVTLNPIQANYGGNKDILLSKWDPTGTMMWLTYLGGEGEEFILDWNREDILIDSENNIIVYGETKSQDFPTKNGFQEKFAGAVNGFSWQSGYQTANNRENGDGFITKIHSNGSLVWSTYIGSSGWDGVYVDLDNNDDLIAYGRTDGVDFPVKSAAQNNYAGEVDAFITKISKDGELLWSTYYGGATEDWIQPAVIDSKNNYYFVSGTDSIGRDVVNEYQKGFGGDRADLFIAKFDTNGVVQWSTYFGGSGNDDGDFTEHGDGDLGFRDGTEIFLDNDGNVVIFTRTSSPEFVDRLINPLPEFGIPDRDKSGGFLGVPLIAKFDPDGNPIHISLVGGSDAQIVSDIIIDKSNNLYMTGTTGSFDYPVFNQTNTAYIQSQHNGGVLDISITKMAGDGTGVWSTYFGGSSRDDLIRSSLDQDGNLYLIGTTRSPDFPNTGSKLFSGEEDLFVAKFSVDGDLAWSILIGGSGSETINRYGILTLPFGGFVLLGTTLSNDLLISGEVSQFDQNSFIAKFNEEGEEVFSAYLFGEKQDSDQENEVPVEFIILALITISGGGLVFVNRYLRRKDEMKVFLNDKMTDLLSPIFLHKPSLIYVFATTKINDDKNLQKEIYTEIPGEIFDFRYFMHPIRLSMIKLLDENPTLTSIQMKDALGIDWKDITNHLNSLRKKGYITIEQMFIEDAIRSVIVANPNTLSQFKTLKEVLFEFLDASPNIDKYLELASDLKNREDSDDMYPTD